MTNLPKLILSAEKAHIFRITHIANIQHVLAHGVQCRSSAIHNPNFINIGNPDLIDKRNRMVVPAPPGGTLSDYVPFYFTPYSMMLLNIKTGYNGIPRRKNEEIVIIASSLMHLNNHDVTFLFTDKHAYCEGARFFTDLTDLKAIDWEILRNRDFRRDLDDPAKTLRYQAEALVHGHLEVKHMRGMACFNEQARQHVQGLVDQRKLDLPVICRPNWYF